MIFRNMDTAKAHIVVILTLLTVQAAQAQERSPKPLAFEGGLSSGPVFVVPVEGMIDNGLATYIGRALSDAGKEDASLVLLHIDTFGGLVNAADKIRKDLLDAEMPTVAFIDKNAASAGALISYAADRIVMVPGASIGAATVVEGVGGEAAPDKYQSYMRGLMRATAEANGRDPQIAESMVDPALEVAGVTAKGQVLTLSAQEALGLGVADSILDNPDAVISAFGVASAAVVAHRETIPERILRFLGSPVLQSILMLMMLGGLYFELQTPGVGFAGLIALVGAMLFFAPLYLLGLVQAWELVIFAVGIALILIELFVLPGFGIAGITGIILALLALVVSLVGNVGLSFPPIMRFTSAIVTVAATLAMLVILTITVGRMLPASGRLNTLILSPELASAEGYTSAETHREYLGKTGVTLTPLRPSGAIMMGEKRVDVITAGDFIDEGVTVKVVDVRGSRVEVRSVS